jgi:peptidoglycan/xylan/chitin deacetylase (PgdA/CDA1 family)
MEIGMRSLAASIALAALTASSAIAAECPGGRPDALGTERVLVVAPQEHTRIGTMQYPESLPLADNEVVLTFDDGPLPPYTDRILETLAAECVKATFFMVGRQANAYPATVRRVYNEGHTIASHSQNHPLIFTKLALPRAQQEVDQGIHSIAAALGNPRALAPFFRFPGLGRSRAVEAYLASHGLMTWSADAVADDWTHISAQQVLHRALQRLEQKHKGILLLHDIQPATALMLPQLLRELKARGYHIVQVVPAGPDRPRTVTEPETWVMHKPAKPAWPAVLTARAVPSGPSAQSFGWPHPFQARLVGAAPISTGLTNLLDTRLPAQLVAASPDEQAILAVKRDPWLEAAPAVPPYGLPAGLGELTTAMTPEDLDGRVVAGEETLDSMVANAPWSMHVKPRPASGKPRTRPASLHPTIAPGPARPKFVAHSADPGKPVPSLNWLIR